MINKCILMGRLTRDPELRHTGSGTAVCSFTVAVPNGFGENQTADFVPCVAWGNTAVFVSKYFSKGTMIIVSGNISTRVWEDKEQKKHYIREVTVSEASFGERKKDNPADEGYVEIETPDDLPFENL